MFCLVVIWIDTSIACAIPLIIWKVSPDSPLPVRRDYRRTRATSPARRFSNTLEKSHTSFSVDRTPLFLNHGRRPVQALAASGEGVALARVALLPR